MARIDGARRPAAGELAAAEQKHRHGRRASRTARATRTAMLLGATVVLACHVGAATAQQPVRMHHHRQLMHSQLSVEQDNHYFDRRQANGTAGDTGIDVSISNTGIIPGGSSTTTALPSGGSSTTWLDPSSSSGSSSTSLDPSASQSSTTEGDLSNTQTTTLPTSPTTTSIPPTTSTSDTTSATSATSQDVITTIIITTLDNGSIMTSASTASSTSAASNNSDDGEPSNHKAWIIPLSVVGEWWHFDGFLTFCVTCKSSQLTHFPVSSRHSSSRRLPLLRLQMHPTPLF